MARLFSYILILLTTGCATIQTLESRRTLPLAGFEGRWAGSVTPAADHCGAATKGVLTIAHDGFVFDPFQSTTVIHGRFDEAAGGLEGSYERPRGAQGTSAGSGSTMLSIAFAGHAVADADGSEHVTGTLTSARCVWEVRLDRY